MENSWGGKNARLVRDIFPLAQYSEIRTYLSILEYRCDQLWKPAQISWNEVSVSDFQPRVSSSRLVSASLCFF